MMLTVCLVLITLCFALASYRHARLYIAKRKYRRELRRNALYLNEVGGPGAGKGTVAAGIATEYRIPTVSTGALFRAEVAAGTRRGRKIKASMERGELLPDWIVIKMMDKELAKEKYDNGINLDGYPRTLEQAKALDRRLAKLGGKLTASIFLDVPEPDLIERLSLRRSCSKQSCGRSYHNRFFPPKIAETCDACGAKLFQRSDDVPEAIRERLEKFREVSGPLCDYYRASGRLITITSTNAKGPQQVLAEVLTAVDKQRKEKR